MDGRVSLDVPNGGQVMTTRTPIPVGTPGADGPRQDPRSRRWRAREGGWLGISLGWWTAIAMAVIGAILVGALIASDGGTSGVTTRSVMDIATDPRADLGEQVVVTGRIDELLTDRAVVLGSDLTSDEVLVLVDPTAYLGGYGIGTGYSRPMPAGEVYDQGDVAQFTGTLHEFDREELSADLGLVLNDELFDAWEGALTIVVDRLDVATVGNLEARTEQEG